jgi:Flp pilus assembly protein protease CpaA
VSPAQIALWIVLSVALALSVATDVRSKLILDRVTLPALAAALLVRAAWMGTGDLSTGLVSGAVGAACGAAALAALAALGRMGWGDVKLMAAAGAALGFPLVVAALLFTSLWGAAQAAVAFIWKRSRAIPYAVAIALGSVSAVLWERAGGGA